MVKQSVDQIDKYMAVQNFSKFSFMMKSFSALSDSDDRRFLSSASMSPAVLQTRLLGMIVGGADRYRLASADKIG